MQVPALNRVTLNIRRGEFAAIMEKSGSGKSTLLHQLGLLDMLTEGEITIDETEISGLTEAERTRFRLEKFGYVFQEYAILPELTALENMYLPAMAMGLSRDECVRSGMNALEKVRLAERADHRPRELSGGEQQRVAVARALINKPKILFADAPTANPDSVSSRQILELFRALNRDMGQTILMVTHELEDAEIGTRVIWLADGGGCGAGGVRGCAMELKASSQFIKHQHPQLRYSQLMRIVGQNERSTRSDYCCHPDNESGWATAPFLIDGDKSLDF